jgi:hypothetical protein
MVHHTLCRAAFTYCGPLYVSLGFGSHAEKLLKTLQIFHVHNHQTDTLNTGTLHDARCDEPLVRVC